MISRESFLSTAASFVAASLAGHAGATPHPADAAILDRLMEGNRRYMNGTTIHGDRTARRDELRASQRPFAMILSCADSRVPPELIFDQTLGDLFVVRIAGNYAETGGIGSFEYAFEHFHSPLLMVLGHSGCGAMKATVEALDHPGGAIPGDIATIVRALSPAVAAVRGKPGDIVANATAENARANARRLQSVPPILSKGTSSRSLRVMSAVYNLKSGGVTVV